MALDRRFSAILAWSDQAIRYAFGSQRSREQVVDDSLLFESFPAAVLSFELEGLWQNALLFWLRLLHFYGFSRVKLSTLLRRSDWNADLKQCIVLSLNHDCFPDDLAFAGCSFASHGDGNIDGRQKSERTQLCRS